jgi:bifunctional non-homologous end joining protein LigD
VAQRKTGTARSVPLQRYRERRDFRHTPEPGPVLVRRQGHPLQFVVQKHAARNLHYDFRLELDGVLLSWALPKGPSLDPKDKRMAVRTEDHPLAYADFEGTIPSGHYGAGTVIVWDRGHWTPVGDAHAGLAAGKLGFELQGHKLQGRWELVRMRKAGERQPAWLLLKARDEMARARADYDVLSALPQSVQGRGMPRDSAPRAAVPAPLPCELAPQLATLATEVPEGGPWIFESKFDGYRLLTRIEAGEPRLLTRGGNDWTARLPTLAAELRAWDIDNAWLDGEIVVAGKHGGDDFNALQNAFDREHTQAVQYKLFDLPYFADHDLREAPLRARRELLQQLLSSHRSTRLRFSESLGEGPADTARALLHEACAQGREGLMAKRADAPYRSARSSDWLKLKCRHRQEFVVAGYRLRSDDAAAVGSLLLALHDAQGRLQPAGSVGTGWDRDTARALLRRLRPLISQGPPFADGASGAKAQHWVRPQLVVEADFGGWTPAGRVRHAVFRGIRADKPAQAVVRERPRKPVQLSTDNPAAAPGGPALHLTHPQRVIDASTGLTKRDLAQYYESVAELLLPQLKGRPVALLRAPEGVDGPTFFQRHGGAGFRALRAFDAALWPGHEPLLEIGTRRALRESAQMNVIEFHTWNALGRRLQRPDRMVFDLDPGEGVHWPAVREAAQLTRALLQELRLQSWLKTSGGKGLHVVVPIAARWTQQQVKGLSRALVRHLAATLPSRFVARSGAAHRKGRIFVDYLRNGEGATTVAAYSARARPGLGVSMPLSWDELPRLEGAAQWTITNAQERLHLPPPWAELPRQSLAMAIKMLGLSS